MARGANQSVDTKFATVLACDAITLIESGRVNHGLDVLKRAVAMLSDIGKEVQIQAELETKSRKVAFNG